MPSHHATADQNHTPLLSAPEEVVNIILEATRTTQVNFLRTK